MKNKINSLKYIFFLFFFTISNAYAQNSLNKENIENYIETIPELRQLEIAAQSEKTESPDEAETSPPLVQNFNGDFSRTPISDILSELKKQPFYDDFKSIIEKHNFESPETWAKTGDMIMMAYSAYHLKNPPVKNAPSVDTVLEDLAQKSKNIESNPYISSEQKQTLLNKLKNSIALLNDPNYIENNNISVISPYIARLNSLFKEPQ